MVIYGGASTWVFECIPSTPMWRPQEDIRHFLLSPPALFFFNIGSSTHPEAHHFPSLQVSTTYQSNPPQQGPSCRDIPASPVHHFSCSSIDGCSLLQENTIGWKRRLLKAHLVTEAWCHASWEDYSGTSWWLSNGSLVHVLIPLTC